MTTEIRGLARSSQEVVRSSLLIGTGALLIGGAAVLSATRIDSAVGATPGMLAWGPALFRALLAAHGAALVLVGLLGSRQTHSLRTPAVAVSDQPTERTPWLILIVLSGVALALRLWALDSCLWFDEVLTVVDFLRLPFGAIVTSFPNQNQHMLFSVLAHASIMVFGDSAWAVRLPSVAFGVGSLWTLFFLGRRITGTREALLACTLMTVSYHHVWFSQNARGYMGLLFFSLLATWLWIEGRVRPGWRWQIAYAVTSALGMWIHMTMVFVSVTHALLLGAELGLVVLRARVPGTWSRVTRDAWPPVAALLLAASLTLQLYALSLPEFLRTGLHEVSLESEWTNPLWVFTESMRSMRIGFGAAAVVLAGMLVAGAGWLSLARRDWVSASVLIIPPVLGGLTMVVLGHNLWPRFFFFSMGFALLIAVHGAMTLPQFIARLIPALRHRPALVDAGGLAVTMLMILASLLSLPRVYALPKQDFTGARDYVEHVREPGDGVVAVGLAGVAYQRLFAPTWLVAESGEALEAMRRTHTNLWLVYTIPVHLKAYRPEIWDLVSRDFELVKQFPGTLGGGAVNVCRARGSST